MLNIIKQEIEMEKGLKQKLEFICDFCNTTPTIINGSIRKLDKTNLTYIEPHKVIIKNITFLVFNYSTDIYIKNLNNKIQLSELENYIKRLEQLETIGNSYEGVEKTYAMQAGREVRVMVKPDIIDDAASYKLARDMKEQIEKEMQYPGTIKITVIRETRAQEEAK